MNRELKFRVWNDADKTWDNPAILEVFSDGRILRPLYAAKDGGDWKKQYFIQQYTGLKDQSGKEIYEGDIIVATEARFETHLLEDSEESGASIYFVDVTKPLPSPDVVLFKAFVKWNITFCRFDLEYISSTFSSGVLSTGLVDTEYNYHIIGNIYENPYLLK